jgi:hypothetical protein
MSPSTRVGRLSPYRLAILVVFLGLFGAGVAFTDEPLAPTVLVMGVLVAVYLLASAFDSVRDHPLFNVANAAWLTVVFVLWYVSTDESIVVLAFAVLAAVGTAVEAYNYRNDTSYLRIDF